MEEEYRDRPNRVPWPPVLLLCSACGAWLGAHWMPLALPWPATWLPRVLGGTVLLAAVCLDVAAMREMRRQRANILPHRAATALVTSGPFAFTRNPIYVANVALLVGVGLIAGEAWYLIAAVIDGVLTDRLAVRREERHLAMLFGPGWMRYVERVPRWIGWK